MFEVATFKLWVDAFTREYSIDLDFRLKVTWDVAQYPLYHVTCAPANFEVGTSNGLEEDAFTRKYIIWPRSQEMLPSILCITWRMHLQSLKLLRPTVMSRCFYKKIQYLTLALRSNDTWDVAQCPLCTCKVWSCGVQRFRRRCVYMKID